MIVTRTSALTGKTHRMDIPVTEDQLREFQQGGLIQKVFPNLNADQREFIKSGITPEEWEAHLGTGK